MYRKHVKQGERNMNKQHFTVKELKTDKGAYNGFGYLKKAVEEMTAEQKIKSILSARRNLYAAGIALLEVDDTYAGNIKQELEQYTIASHTAPSAKEPPKPLDEDDIRFYLEIFLRIYIREKDILIDAQNSMCYIKLNERITAKIPMQNATAVKSIFVFSHGIQKTFDCLQENSGMIK